MSTTYRLVGGVPTLPKDPDATLDYSFDWTDWLAACADTLQSAAISASGVTVGAPTVAGSVVVVRISGGSVGSTALVSCRITTTSGQVDERTIGLQIEQR